jgi:hypothetical protein
LLARGDQLRKDAAMTTPDDDNLPPPAYEPPSAQPPPAPETPSYQAPPPPPPPGYQAQAYPPPGYAPPAYGAPGYAPPGYGPPQPGAPWGVDQYGRPYSDKSKIIAGVLQLVLGGVGAGRWYTGHYGIAVAQLLTCGGLGIWALIDGIMMLVGNVTDPQGRPLHG